MQLWSGGFQIENFQCNLLKVVPFHSAEICQMHWHGVVCVTMQYHNWSKISSQVAFAEVRGLCHTNGLSALLVHLQTMQPGEIQWLLIGLHDLLPTSMWSCTHHATNPQAWKAQEIHWIWSGAEGSALTDIFPEAGQDPSRAGLWIQQATNHSFHLSIQAVQRFENTLPVKHAVQVQNHDCKDIFLVICMMMVATPEKSGWGIQLFINWTLLNWVTMSAGQLLVVFLNDSLQNLRDLAVTLLLVKLWRNHLLKEACEHKRVDAEVLSSLWLCGWNA